MPEWYPVMLNLSGKLCVIVGGGPVAERKADGLLDTGALVRIVSPDATPRLRMLAEAGRLEWKAREASERDVEDAALVFAAAGDSEANRRIAEAARRRGVPVNRADDGEAGDFMLPAVLRRGKFVVAAGVSGAGPALASRVIRELAGRFGPEYAEYAEALGLIRETVKREVADPAERRRLLQAAAEEDALEEWRAADWLRDRGKLLERLRSRAFAGRDED